EQIPYVDFLADFQAASDPDVLYRDHIHLSSQGYALVSQALSAAIAQGLQTHDITAKPLPDSLLEDPW
ncbi:MAG: SGNH/GDSL hydrolase family protein, partial [Cyanobacteria bacterium P01_C01_bin.147]